MISILGRLSSYGNFVQLFTLELLTRQVYSITSALSMQILMVQPVELVFGFDG